MNFFLWRHELPGVRCWECGSWWRGWIQVSRRRRWKPEGRGRDQNQSPFIASSRRSAACHWLSANTTARWLWFVWDAAEESSGWGRVVFRSAPHASDQPPSSFCWHACSTAHAFNSQMCPADGWWWTTDSTDASLWYLWAHHVSD